jgi:V-type H+-transporting ATPase subunit a
VMFGDLGHGSILFTFGAFLTLFANSLKNSGLAIMLPGRYMLMMMGMGSAYCGFIYNEWFAMPIQLFESCYDSGRTNYVNATG